MCARAVPLVRVSMVRAQPATGLEVWEGEEEEGEREKGGGGGGGGRTTLLELRE